MLTMRSALLHASVHKAYASLSVVLPSGVSALTLPTSRLSIHDRYWWCMKARGFPTGIPMTAPLRLFGLSFSLMTLWMTSIPWISMPC